MRETPSLNSSQCAAGQPRCRGLLAAAAYLRGLCALWPQGRIEGSKYVE